MVPRALHLPRLPRVQPAPEIGPAPGAPFESNEIVILRTRLAKSPDTPVTCPRCGAPIEHDAGEEHEATRMTTWVIQCQRCGGHAVVRASLGSGPIAPVFRTLVASKREEHRVRRTVPSLASSTFLHVILIGLAVRYTLGSGISTTTALADTTMVYLTQDLQEAPEPEPEPEAPQTRVIQLEQVAKGFQTIDAPIDIPTSIPPIDLNQRFDPRDYSGTGVEGGIFAGVEGGDALLTGDVSIAQVFREGAVDEPPERISGPPLRYPRILRQAGISGRVLLKFVVGTDGKAEKQSIEVLQASNVGFIAAAQDVIIRSTFRPGRVRGVTVRVLVTQRIEFNIVS